MGFDDGECYICYARNCTNIECERAEICFNCLGALLEEDICPNITARWQEALRNSISQYTLVNGVCSICLKGCNALINLSICKYHKR